MAVDNRPATTLVDVASLTDDLTRITLHFVLHSCDDAVAARCDETVPAPASQGSQASQKGIVSEQGPQPLPVDKQKQGPLLLLVESVG